MKSIVILISGRGSNMEAIVNTAMPVEIRAVISNRPDAKGLLFAASRGIATDVVDHKAFVARADFDAALANAIARHQPDFIVLAGFMRVLTGAFLAQFANRIVNIHPSLLPAFPGLHTHRQALTAGVKLHGATVHFVTPTLDHGPIIVQAAVPVMQGDAEATLAARVLVQEHRIYPMALKWLLEDRLQIMPDGVVQLKGSDVSEVLTIDHLCNPCE